MNWAAALFVVAAFLVLAKWFRVPALARESMQHCRTGLRDLQNPALGEDDKERALQLHAKRLLALFVGLTLASCAALALPLGVLALLDAAGVLELAAVLKQATSWQFLGVATLCGVAAMMRMRSRRQ